LRVSTPNFVAGFILRSPEDVAASKYHRELGPLALYVPILPCFVLLGLFHLKMKEKQSEENIEIGPPSETTSLLEARLSSRRISGVLLKECLSPRVEMHRRRSVEVMGIVLPETASENERRLGLLEQFKNADGETIDDDTF
jgi:hypothetical protein